MSMMKNTELANIVQLFSSINTEAHTNYCLSEEGDKNRTVDIYLPFGCALFDFPEKTCIDLIPLLSRDEFSVVINRCYSDYYENKLANMAVILYDSNCIDEILRNCFEGKDDIHRYFTICDRRDAKGNLKFDIKTFPNDEFIRQLKTFKESNVCLFEGANSYDIDGVGYSTDKLTLTYVPKNITTLEVPENVKKIGYGAFFDCKKLQKVVLPKNLQVIGPFAFRNCESLQCVTIPSNVSQIYSAAFAGCKSLSEIEFLGDKLSIIEASVFYDSGIKSLVVPPQVYEIKDKAFKNCLMLTNVVLNDKLETIGDSAFEGCRNVKHIEIGDCVTELGDSTFKNCLNLQYVKLSHNLLSINNSMFYGCSSLKCIYNLETVRIVKEKAFKNCTSLKEVKLCDDIDEIRESAFENCSCLENISSLSNNCKIAPNAFFGCSHTPSFRKRIFISYSWDSESHKKWVSKLAKYLDSCGFDVYLDEYQKYGTDLDKFMSEDIVKSDIIMVIATPRYKERTEIQSSGVYKEMQMIKKRIEAKQHFKCIPILRIGNSEESLPKELSGLKAFEIYKRSKWKKNIDNLIIQIVDN